MIEMTKCAAMVLQILEIRKTAAHFIRGLFLKGCMRLELAELFI